MNPIVKIKIKEFGPIKEAEVTFAPLMIFTGNSNLGKSYVNYLTYYFIYSFTDGSLGDLYSEGMNAEAEGKQAFSFTASEVKQWLDSHVEGFMRNFLGDENLICQVEFEFTPAVDTFQVELEIARQQTEGMVPSRESQIHLAVNKNYIRDFGSSNPRWVILFYINTFLLEEIAGVFCVQALLLPPARGAFVGENYSLKEKIVSNTAMYRQFLLDYYDYATDGGNPDKEKERIFFIEQLQALIGSDLTTEKDKQYLMLPSGQRLSLTAAASSIKELSPLLFYLKNYSNLPTSICLEEPEAHLHPDMQIAVADLLAACLTQNMILQLTTHSDYFLQRINQLIKIGYLRSKDESLYRRLLEERKISDRSYIDGDRVKAYYFHLDDGQVKIEDLEITEKGIPMTTFFDTIRKLNERENYINDLLGELKTE